MKVFSYLFVMICLTVPAYANDSLTRESVSEDLSAMIEELLREKPELVLSVLEDNPVILANLVDNAVNIRGAKEEEKQWQAELMDPKVPVIHDDRPVRGTRHAPITIVEYSDFECPYCQAVSPTLMQILQDYEGSVSLVYKHNPLSFHPGAEPAARYFEAIALQDQEQAWKFHDQVFDRQHELAEGESILEQIAASLDIDQEKLVTDLNSDVITTRLHADQEEAYRFGFDGTPAFVVNGISVVGNQPREVFDRIIALFL